MTKQELQAAKEAGTVLAAHYGGGHESPRNALGIKLCIPVTIVSLDSRKAGYGGTNKTVAYVRPVPERATDLRHLPLADQPRTPLLTEEGLLARRVWERDIPEEEQAVQAVTVEGRSIYATWAEYVTVRTRFIEARDEQRRQREEKWASHARSFDNLERALAGSDITFDRTERSGVVSFKHAEVEKLAAHIAELRGAAVES